MEKCKLAKSFVFQYVFDDFGGSGPLKIDQNGVKWRSKSLQDGPWTENMHPGGLRGAKLAPKEALEAPKDAPRDPEKGPSHFDPGTNCVISEPRGLPKID